MRSVRLLPLVIVAAGCGKDPPAVPVVTSPVAQGIQAPPHPALNQEAIPQDPEQMKRTRAERLAGLRATGVEAYAKVGNRDPKWDAAVTDALEKVARAKAVADRDGDVVEAAADALAEAVRLGCDDPYVRYMHVKYVHLIELRGGTSPKAQTEVVAVSRALQASRYPAIRRANAAHNANVNLAAPTTLDGITAALRSKDWAAELDFAVRAVRDDPHGGAETYVELAELSQVYFGRVPGGREKAYEAFRDALAGVPNPEALRLWLKGKFLLDRGWATRGPAIAALVPAENMRGFADDLAAAADALEAAWALDPTQPDIAVAGMTAAGPTGDFEGLEAWFRRAMTADGDCYKAVRRKAEFLHPKWGGDPEALRDFADRLVATRNWDGLLPLEGVYVLSQVNAWGFDVSFADRDWPTVERVFDEFLRRRPDSRWAWSLLAQAAARPLRPAAIRRAADHLGDKPSRVVFRPGEFEALVKRAQAAEGH